jgi:transposase InsO family protein
MSPIANGWWIRPPSGRLKDGSRLSVVLDLFSRMVVGWSLAAIQDATLVVQALRMALARRRPQAGLLHHSDRGSTYTNESYQQLLAQEGMQSSMSRTADCYDNAAMESFASLVSKVKALKENISRHERKPEAFPLNSSSASTIVQEDTLPYTT